MSKMTEVEDGDLDRGGGPCLAEQHEKMAREGDIQGLWRVLTDNDRTVIDQTECFRLLLQAVEVAAQAEPGRFSAEVFARVLGFSTYLLLRTHLQLGFLLDRHDACSRTASNSPLPHAVVEALPALIQLQEHVAAMAESQARAARLWGLAGATRRGASSEAAGGGGAETRGARPFRIASTLTSHTAEEA